MARQPVLPRCSPGRLKENGRATLVGAATFGKGCLQRCSRWTMSRPRCGSGIKLTVMKFFSPTNQPYSGRGVTPHVVVPYDIMDARRAGIQQARRDSGDDALSGMGFPSMSPPGAP
jgi:C-terminal processing protease CtpA/Prc